MGRKFGKKNREPKPRRERTGEQYQVAVKENKKFETYYKAQNIVPQSEWDAFMTALTSTLPVSFRITGNFNQANAFNKILQMKYFAPLKDASALQASVIARPNTGPNGGTNAAPVEDEPIKALVPKRLTWYPNEMAYQLNQSRKDIRRSEPNWQLHQCLISETQAGSISRQETVSMIPPLLMDIQPHHKVLDMCAAPGSKTAQLIEQLHGGSAGDATIPSGVVIANDSDNKRCYLLTHQTKRLGSPSMMVTNNDAAFMPNFKYTKPDGSVGKLKFDRILCDVPCSGDGTLRKNCDIWTKWNPINAANLHGLQLRIARRGLMMLAVGGRLVYSTCSMSPLENEAVLQRLIDEAKGAVELVDVSKELPGLKTSPGLRTWTVMDRDMNIVPNPEEIPTNLTSVFTKELFPSGKDIGLERCLRLLPHAQDTGAFFVAVLHKTRPMPTEKVEGAQAPPLRSVAPPQQRHKGSSKKRPQGYKEEPYFYLCDEVAEWQRKKDAGELPDVVKEVETAEGENENGTQASETGSDVENKESETADEGKLENGDAKTAENGDSKTTDEAKAEPAEPKTPVDPKVEDVRVWSMITDFFGFKNDVPEVTYANFMTRTKETSTRNLYFTNTLVRDLVNRNQHDTIKIINTGVRAFVKAENKGATCTFRVSQEGVNTVSALITRTRVLPVTRDDLVLILNDNDKKVPPELKAMSCMCQEVAQGLVSGSVIMEYRGDPSRPDSEQADVAECDKIKVLLVGWKGANSLRCYVAKEDRVHYLRKLHADTSRYVFNKFQVARDAAAEEQREKPAEDVATEAKPDENEAPAKKIKLDSDA